ncbi:TPR-containing protein [Prunus yedoensis var. nudiflora]|uniref:TPR-containing protein n=1 Tax=Prunus yedoensis var. nudiflora TaxID=2094558 RepID=A0A314XJD8_PRUYE|nr:TPR-containing protein [Prunus yedoensis var. nudiflora]
MADLLVGQPPYRSSGERGGEPFKGHQGNFGYNHLRPGGAGPSFIGRHMVMVVVALSISHNMVSLQHLRIQNLQLLQQHFHLRNQNQRQHLKQKFQTKQKFGTTKVPRLLGVKFVRPHAIVWKFLRITRMESDIRRT